MEGMTDRATGLYAAVKKCTKSRTIKGLDFNYVLESMGIRKLRDRILGNPAF